MPRAANQYQLKYRINGVLFRRYYDDQKTADTMAGVLVANGITVVINGPKMKGEEHAPVVKDAAITTRT